MYPIFTVFLIFALFTMVFMNRSTRNSSLNKEAFLEKEREANSTRKKPINDLHYVDVNTDSLPIIETDDEYILERIKTLNYLSDPDVKICNLSQFTNTELKLKYGVANLTLLTEYDQNYTMLCRCLYELGKRLYESGDKDTAVSYLEYGILCGTDLKSHYTLLADIYESELQYKKIVSLIHSAENMNSLLKNSLISDLKGRLKDTNFSGDEAASELEDITL